MRRFVHFCNGCFLVCHLLGWEKISLAAKGDNAIQLFKYHVGFVPRRPYRATTQPKKIGEDIKKASSIAVVASSCKKEWESAYEIEVSLHGS